MWGKHKGKGAGDPRVEALDAAWEGRKQAAQVDDTQAWLRARMAATMHWSPAVREAGLQAMQALIRVVDARGGLAGLEQSLAAWQGVQGDRRAARRIAEDRIRSQSSGGGAVLGGAVLGGLLLGPLGALGGAVIGGMGATSGPQEATTWAGVQREAIALCGSLTTQVQAAREALRAAHEEACAAMTRLYETEQAAVPTLPAQPAPMRH